MKTLGAAVVGLAIALLAQVAAAYVAQAHAIAFTPEGEAVLEGLGADPSSAHESNMPSDDETGESRGADTLHL